ALELIQPSPPAGDLDFGIGDDIPGLGQGVALDQEGDTWASWLRSQKGREMLGQAPQELCLARNGLGLLTRGLGVLGDRRYCRDKEDAQDQREAPAMPSRNLVDASRFCEVPGQRQQAAPWRLP